MPEPIPNPSDVKPAAGIVTPAPTGGQPATPAPEAKPGEAIKAPAVSPIIKMAPPSDAPKPTPTPAAQPGTPAPGVTPSPEAIKPGEEGRKEVPISALHEERSKRQNLELELQQLKDMVQSGAAANVVQPQAQPQQDNVRAEIDKLWDTDPKQAVQAEIHVAMNWRDQVEAQLSAQAGSLSEKYPDFGTYRVQAENYVRSLPVDQRADPRVMEVAYLVVRGQNVDTIVENQKNEIYEKFRSGELAQQFQQPAGTFTAPAPVAGVQLTQDQMNAANMMGMSVEDYASQIQQTAPAQAPAAQ